MNEDYSSLEENVEINERLWSVLAGTLLVRGAFYRRFNLLRSLVGGYLLFRGFTGHCAVYKRLCLEDETETESESATAADRGIYIKSNLKVDKPRSEVFAFWRKLENLPLFMTHLDSVTILDEKFSEWKLKIPGGLGTIGWKSEIVEEIPDEQIHWRSVEGSSIANSGLINFSDAPDGGTSIYVVIKYNAPAGKVGEKAGALLNPVFRRIVRKDIRNFKQYMETGEVPEE